MPQSQNKVERFTFLYNRLNMGNAFICLFRPGHRRKGKKFISTTTDRDLGTNPVDEPPKHSAVDTVNPMNQFHTLIQNLLKLTRKGGRENLPQRRAHHFQACYEISVPARDRGERPCHREARNGWAHGRSPTAAACGRTEKEIMIDRFDLARSSRNG